MAIRVARGYEKIHHPYQELYEGVRPSIQGLRAAKFLPISMLDKLHDDDPIVLLPGTWVGVLQNTHQTASTLTPLTQAANAFITAEAGDQALVPAMVNKHFYQYSAFDSDFGTYTIDDLTNAAVEATAGTSTSMLAAVKPIGVITAPVYSEILKSKYTNYKRDLMPSILMGNYTVVIPAMTNQEQLIQPGDLVRIDGTAVATDTGSTHYAVNKSLNTGGAAGTLGVPGRLRRYAPSTAAEQLFGDYVVGRCVDRYRIAGGGTAGARLSADSATLTNLNADHQFSTLKKVQTVPGLGLSGSGTQGIPAMFEHAVADDDGDYFALVIKVDL